MKFTVPKKELLAALNRCAAIAPGEKATMAILSNVLLDPYETVLRISATDLEIGYVTVIEGIIWDGGDFPGSIPVLLSAARLRDIVKAIPIGEVTFSYDSQRNVTITGGTATFTLAGLDHEEFPQIEGSDGDDCLVNPETLIKTLRHVAYCQCSDITRYNIAGIRLFAECAEQSAFLVAAATDGHRLCHDTNAIETGEDDPAFDVVMPAALLSGVTIPSKAVAIISKIENEEAIALSASGNNLFITTGQERFVIRLVDGDFPDYNKIIPPLPNHSIRVKRQALIDAIERCRIMTNKENRKIQLEFNDDRILLQSSIDKIGAGATDGVTAEITGEPEPVLLNIEYLLQALSNMPGTSCDIFVTSSVAPISISPVGTDFPQAIVMPMRS